MKRRFLNLILVMLMVVCVLPFAASAIEYAGDTCDAGFGSHKWDDGYCVWCALPCKHDYVNGDCTKCDVVCAHTKYVDSKCAECGTACAHTYVNKGYRKGEEPTCVNNGISVLECSVCKATTAQTAFAFGHDFTGKETVTKTATCARTGTKLVQCTRCDETEEKTIEKLAHNYVDVEEIPATCVKDGKTAGKECASCKKPQSGRKTIPATGVHNYTEVVKTIQKATCEKQLVEQKKCATCDATKNVWGEALGHDLKHVGNTVEPTCARTGTAAYECVREGCEYTETKTLEKLEHNYVDVPEVPATCVKDGKTAGKQCSSCKRVLSGLKTIPATGKHTYELVEYVAGKEPTCTQSGVGVHKCAVCGDPENITVPKLGHIKNITVLKEATCTVDGLQCFVCEREGCSQYEFEVITAPGHTEEIVPAVPATCTSTGLTEGKKCSVCGETLLAQEVTDKLAHEFTVSVPGVEATCTADGYTAHKKCANCDATEGKEELDTDGHIFENYICKVCGTRDGSCEHKNRVMKYTAPTCSDKGSQSMWCPDCNYETMDILDEIPHTPKDLSVAPSCSTPGKKHVICAVCNVNIEGPIVLDATNEHTNVNGICSVCGASVCDHSDTTTTTTPSTCAVAGTRTVTCNSCGKVTKTELPLAAHKHVNGICSVCGHRDSDKITFDFQDIHVVGGSAY